ncbi:hypothetical protein [Caproiciproducens sp.]
MIDLDEAIRIVESIPFEPWIELQKGDKEAIAIIINYVKQTMNNKEKHKC